MLAVRADKAFDGEHFIAGGATVLTDQGRIVGIESASAPLPDGWGVVEYSGSTLLPGLIDMHVHLGGDGLDGALDRLPGYQPAELDAVIERALRRQLAAGVTTVRDLGDQCWSAVAWRDRMEAGGVEFPCPTIVASGPPITCPGGHCWFMGGEAAGPEQLRAAVSERAERRVDVVKVMASGGVATPGTDVMSCQFSLEELTLVVEESHRTGLRVTAHAHGRPAVDQAIAAGVDGIEHCSCFVESGVDITDQLLESLAERRVAVCPTLGKVPGAVPSPAVQAVMARTGLTYEVRQAQVGRMHQAGVLLVSGVDAGISSGKPHGILAESVADLVGGGVSGQAALASATSLAAEVCGLVGRKGRLVPGADADLVIVDGDLSQDIGALGHVRAVMAQGQMVGHP